MSRIREYVHFSYVKFAPEIPKKDIYTENKANIIAIISWNFAPILECGILMSYIESWRNHCEKGISLRQQITEEEIFKEVSILPS